VVRIGVWGSRPLHQPLSTVRSTTDSVSQSAITTKALDHISTRTLNEGFVPVIINTDPTSIMISAMSDDLCNAITSHRRSWDFTHAILLHAGKQHCRDLPLPDVVGHGAFFSGAVGVKSKQKARS